MKVYKYALWLYDRQAVRMPAGSVILSVQMQFGTPVMWALVDPREGEVDRPIYIVGTGHEMPEYAGRHLGTVQMRDFVWHVFEGTE